MIIRIWRVIKILKSNFNFTVSCLTCMFIENKRCIAMEIANFKVNNCVIALYKIFL